jgi:hypothetical protein
MTMVRRACSARAVSITCWIRGRPASRCRTFAVRLFMRVPLPAAITTTSTAVIHVPFVPMKSMDPTRIGGIILALALCLALSACSAIKLGYNSLPTLAYWWLDGYADFSDEQAPRVRDGLARLLAWHRQEELPRVVELLERMEQMAPGEITAQQACGVVAAARDRLHAVADQAAPGLTALAVQPHRPGAAAPGTQVPPQQRALRGRVGQAAAVPSGTTSASRQMQERVEMIYGRLDEPQRVVLRRAHRAVRLRPGRALGERQRRQHELLQVLRRLTSPGGVPQAEGQALVRTWLAHAEELARSGLPRPPGRAAAGRLHHLRAGAPEHDRGAARAGRAPAARLPARPPRPDGPATVSTGASGLALVWRLGAATTLIVTAFSMIGPVLAVLLQQAGHGTTFIGAFAMLSFMMVGLLIPGDAAPAGALGHAALLPGRRGAATRGRPGLCPDRLRGGVGLVLGGGGDRRAALWNTTEALLAEEAPPAMRGRVMGAYQTALGGALALGPFLPGLLRLERATCCGWAWRWSRPACCWP